MARVTGAAGKALEAKALKADKKSAGMVMLFEKGYDVPEVAAIFDAPYGFPYGVAVRNGFVKPTARAATNGTGKSKTAKATATKAKASAKAPAKKAKAKASSKK